MADQPGTGDGKENPLAAWIASAGSRLDELMDDIRVGLERSSTRLAESLTAVDDWLSVNGPALLEGYWALRQFAAEAHVQNWTDLTEVEWLKAVRLMQAADGVPIAWLPPAHVVKELIGCASHGERDAVLVRHADEIADQASDLLAAVTHGSLRDLRVAILCAWAAKTTGHGMAAQALAGAAITAAMEDHRGYRGFGELRSEASAFRSKPVADWALAVSLRRTALDCAWATAIAKTDEQLPGFNRHATAHHVSPEQYTEANCMRALMLATAVARELQFDLGQEWLRGRVGASLALSPAPVKAQALRRAGSRPAVVAAALRRAPRRFRDAARAPADGGIPDAGGLYAFWLGREVLPDIVGPAHPSKPLRLLYVGASPVRSKSNATLRSRVIGQHLRGNTDSSTFRLSLAALLFDAREWTPRRQSDRVVLPREHNAALSDWMAEHVRLGWHVLAEPWTVKADAIAHMKPALSLDGKNNSASGRVLAAARERFRAAAT